MRGVIALDRGDRPRLAAREPAARRRRHAAHRLLGDARRSPTSAGQFAYVLVCGLDVTEQTWHDNVQGSLRRVATLVASGTGEAELMDAVTSEIGRLFEGQSANLLRLDEQRLPDRRRLEQG